MSNPVLGRAEGGSPQPEYRLELRLQGKTKHQWEVLGALAVRGVPFLGDGSSVRRDGRGGPCLLLSQEKILRWVRSLAFLVQPVGQGLIEGDRVQVRQKALESWTSGWGRIIRDSHGSSPLGVFGDHRQDLGNFTVWLPVDRGANGDAVSPAAGGFGRTSCRTASMFRSLPEKALSSGTSPIPASFERVPSKSTDLGSPPSCPGWLTVASHAEPLLILIQHLFDCLRSREGNVEDGLGGNILHVGEGELFGDSVRPLISVDDGLELGPPD